MYKAYSTISSEYVALKILRNSEIYLEQSQVEIALLRRLKDEDIPVVKIIENFFCEGYPVIVFELLKENLHSFRVKLKKQRLSVGQIFTTCKQLLESLSFLSREDVRIIHGDLKPENVMLTFSNEFRVKLIDFGSSCLTPEQQYSYIQSRRYRSPEIYIQEGNYTPAIDMWSFGCLIAELYSGKPLFQAKSSDNLFLVQLMLWSIIIVYSSRWPYVLNVPRWRGCSLHICWAHSVCSCYLIYLGMEAYPGPNTALPVPPSDEEARQGQDKDTGTRDSPWRPTQVQ